MKTEQELDKLISQLAPSIEPDRDLWPQLQAKLNFARQRRPLQRWLSAGAALAATVAFIGLLSWQLTTLNDEQQQVITASTSNTPAMISAELQLLQTFEQLKAQQLSNMVAPAPGFDNWQQQSGIWDQAIAQVRYALTFYPDEPQLLAQLQMLYQQQLAYLQQAALPATLMNS